MKRELVKAGQIVAQTLQPFDDAQVQAILDWVCRQRNKRVKRKAPGDVDLGPLGMVAELERRGQLDFIPVWRAPW